MRRAAITLAFDVGILAAMGSLAWRLLTPWSRALDASEGLMLLALLVGGGLWTAFVEDDLARWRRLSRRARRG